MKKTVYPFLWRFLYILIPLVSPAQKNYSELNFLQNTSNG